MLKMISLSRFLAAAIVLLLSTGWMLGQTMTTNFVPANITAPVGQTVDIQLKVSGFTNILTFQFPITFNAAVLQFQSADGFGLPGFGQANVSYQATPTPRIGVSYEAHPINHPTGVTVAAGTSILTLHFKVIADGTTSINVSNQAGLQPVIDIIKDPGDEVTLNFQGGGSTVKGGNGNVTLTGFKMIAGSKLGLAPDTANIGSNICIPVKVNDFDAIESMQFAMHFDKTKLAYTGVQNFNLAGLDATQIIVNAGTGLVNVGWSDPGELINGQYVIDGVSVPDQQTIFEMCFNALGAGGTTTDITIDGIGISGGAEAINHNGQQVWKADTPINGKVFFKNAPCQDCIKIWIDTATVLQNEIKCVDVKVANFITMDQVQLGIAYDPTKLEFVSINGLPGPLNLQQGSTVTTPPTNTAGQIKLAWYDVSPTGSGTTLPDGTTIFSLCFKGIGAINSTNKIEIKELPGANGNNFIIEIFKNGSSVPVTPILTNGHLYITDKPPCSASVQLTTQTNPKCFNGNDGAIDITANGTGNLMYSWTGPQSFTASTADIGSLKPGTYLGTVSSSAGCSATLSVTLVNPQQITASGTGTGVTCFGGSNGSIDLTAGGGTGNLTYAWSGPSSPGAVQDPANLAAGNYFCTISDANACTATTSAILVPTPGPISFQNVSTIQPTCFNSNNGSISLEATGGTPPFTYAWSGPNVQNPTNPSISNLGTGVFQVTATDSKSCPKTSQTFAIQPPAELKVNVDAVGNVKCFDDVNGSISITPSGGTPGYSFEWKNSAGTTVNVTEDPTGLPAGVYSVIVKDNKNCTATTTSVTIASPSSALTVSAPTTTNVTCPGGSDGSISLSVNGGWGSPKVAWTPGSVPAILNPTNLPAGNYTATITDDKGCTKTQTAQITAPQAIELTNTTVNHLKCHDSGNGSISINVTGGTAPLNVVWSPSGQSGTTISALGAGVYTPSITDSKQCTKTFPAITVNAPTQLIADQQNVNDANGSNNGSITVEISGGTKPYNYKWSQSGAPNIKTLSAPAGTYTVTVEDANGCVLILTNVIGQKSVAFAPLFTSATPTCFGVNEGCLKVNLNTKHVPHLPVKIDWAGGTTTTSDSIVNICGLAGGIYSLTLTAATGQVSVLNNLNVLQNPIVQHQVNSNDPNEDYKNGGFDLSPILSNGSYSYHWEWWENGTLKTANTQDLISLDSGTYCVTITDLNTNCKINFCKSLVRVWKPIEKNDEEVVHPTCVYSSDGSIKIVLKGGNPKFIYKWVSSNGGTFPDTNKINNLRAGIYSLTVVDENGTKWSGSWTLKPKSTLAATATVTPGPNGYDVSGPKECDGEVKISTTGQFGAVTYQWSNTTTTAINSTLCKGAWWAIVTDAAGCADTLNGNLVAPPAVVFGVNISNYNGFNVRCAGGSDGEAAVTVSGGVPPYQVAWSTGFSQTINTASGITHQKALAAGTYYLTVTDANDIESVDTLTLTEPEAFVINIKETEPTRFTECDGKMELSSNGAEPVAYSWVSQIANGSSELIEELCSNEKVSVLAVDANGCKATIEERLDWAKDGCLIFRPVLTPGQTEGKNDDLFVTCIESVPENTLEIYNRWGQIVYQTDAYDNGSKVWKGTTSKGLPLPEGVYYYILNYKNSRDEQQQVKGYVNLLR